MHYGNYDMAAVYERAMREVDAELSRAIEIEKAADKVFARHDGALRRLAGTNEKQTEGAAN